MLTDTVGHSEPSAINPILCWHGTDCAFDQPCPLTHFGTRTAALSAPGYGGVLMECVLDIRNPLTVPDEPGGGDTWYWIRFAVDSNVLSEAEFKAWERVATDEAAVELLQSKGFDGLTYENRFEEPGSVSWVIFDPMQAVIVSTVMGQAYSGRK